MKGLYNKVLSGKYDRIPRKYSPDLSTVIAMLLQVSPKKRPSCDDLLDNPIIEKYMIYADDFMDQHNA